MTIDLPCEFGDFVWYVKSVPTKRKQEKLVIVPAEVDSIHIGRHRGNLHTPERFVKLRSTTTYTLVGRVYFEEFSERCYYDFEEACKYIESQGQDASEIVRPTVLTTSSIHTNR